MKAEREIKNDTILAALVGNTGCRGDFKRGMESVLDCLILNDICKAVLHFGLCFQAEEGSRICRRDQHVGAVYNRCLYMICRPCRSTFDWEELSRK